MRAMLQPTVIAACLVCTHLLGPVFPAANASPSRDPFVAARKVSMQRGGLTPRVGKNPQRQPTGKSGALTQRDTFPGWLRSAYWSRARTTTTLNKALETTRFNRRFSRALRSLLIHRVPLVPRKDATLPWVDAQFFSDFGLPLGRFGLIEAGHEKLLLQEIALRPAEAGETPTRHAEATRYSDEGVKTVISNQGDHGTVRMGRWVVGDGRAGMIGAPLMHKQRAKNGRRTLELASLRVKGIPTGLKPLQQWDDVHTTGNQGDRWAVMDVVISQFLHANGIKVNRIPALATTHDSFTNELYGFQSVQNKAFQLNAGHFDRLAHLNEIRQSPRAIAEFLSEINALVCAELGRKQPLSMAGLFRHLVRRKAHAVADLYWMRVAHGSPTFDNIGLLQTIDVSTVTPVDAAHPRLAMLRGVSDGFAAEPQQFLTPYSEFLLPLLIKAVKKRDRLALLRINGKALIQRELEQHMAANALEHLGVDLDAITWLMKSVRPEVMTFIRTVRQIGEQEATGAVTTMGAAVKTEVKDPARYTIFMGLGRLAAIWGSSSSREAKLTALVAALRPVDGQRSRDRRAAAALLDAVGPLLTRLTAQASRAQRNEMIKLMADQALRLNKPIDQMVRSSLDAWGKELYNKVHAGQISHTRFRGEINALTRAHIRRGPRSVSHIVQRIRHGTLPRDGAECLVLSRIDEHGVRIEEISDPRGHSARFTIAAVALAQGLIKHPRLSYCLDGKTWREAAPTRSNNDGEVVFEIPIRRAPVCIKGKFIDARDRSRVWDLDGLGFGEGHQPLLASVAVKAALAAWQGTGSKSAAHELTAQAARLRAQPWISQAR